MHLHQTVFKTSVFEVSQHPNLRPFRLRSLWDGYLLCLQIWLQGLMPFFTEEP